MGVDIAAYVIFQWIVFSSTMGQDIHCFRHYPSNKFISGVFLTLESIGLQQCSKQCLLRSHCLILSYNVQTSTCGLGTEDALLVDGPPPFKHIINRRSELSLFEHILLNSCAGHSCHLGAICIELSSGEATCLTTLELTITVKVTTTHPLVVDTTTRVVCGEPPPVVGANSPTSTDREIGSKVTYTCKSDHITSGNPEITCQSDGQWSTSSQTCTNCDPAYFTFEESLNFCYMVEFTMKVDYAGAKTQCSNIGGKLAKLDTQAKVTFMETLTSAVGDLARFYLDGNDQLVETVWVFDDGSAVDMSLFAPGRPYPDESNNDCIAFQKQTNALVDHDCGKKRNFMCEKA